VFVLSFVHHHLSTTFTLALAANLASHPGQGPSPLLRDVGLAIDGPSNQPAQIPATTAPPLSRGMWAAHPHIDDACSPTTTTTKMRHRDYGHHDHLDAKGDEA
jgi:hypothetical protein